MLPFIATSGGSKVRSEVSPHGTYEPVEAAGWTSSRAAPLTAPNQKQVFSKQALLNLPQYVFGCHKVNINENGDVLRLTTRRYSVR